MKLEECLPAQRSAPQARECAFGLTHRGECLLHLGDTANADRDFARALELEPTDAKALAGRAWVQLRASPPRDRPGPWP